jgi:hypothetical protein
VNEEATLKKMRRAVGGVVSVLVVVGPVGLLTWLAWASWNAISRVDPAIAAALITAATTVIGATLTVTIGRYLERKRELEAINRDKKMPIYARFLTDLFTQLQGSEEEKASTDDYVVLLRKWHQDLLLWGGPDVINAYLAWKDVLRRGEPSADSMFKMDALIFAIRKELGNSNFRLARGVYAHITLRHPEVFFEMAANNPNVLLSEVGDREKELGLEE